MFMGVVGPYDEKRVCKIKCVSGRWVGPLCSLEHGECVAVFLYCVEGEEEQEEAEGMHRNRCRMREGSDKAL